MVDVPLFRSLRRNCADAGQRLEEHCFSEDSASVARRVWEIEREEPPADEEGFAAGQEPPWAKPRKNSPKQSD